MTKRICSIERCPGSAYCRGWCRAHYARWQRNGDPEGGRHVYVLDERYFDSIDAEGKAYWLGFITADGCVQAGRDVNGWRCHQLRVKLKASDSGHLEKLKTAMAAENPVRFVPQIGQAGPATEIAFSSERLVNSLIHLGVTPRKSLTVQPWSGPEHLMRHYWRGMLDGDGTIVRHPGERDKWHIRFLGTEASVEAFRRWAAPLCGSAAKSYPKGKIWQWTIGGLAAPQSVARELYGDATTFLDRKHALAFQLMAVPTRHRSRGGEVAGVTPGRARATRSAKAPSPGAS